MLFATDCLKLVQLGGTACPSGLYSSPAPLFHSLFNIFVEKGKKLFQRRQYLLVGNGTEGFFGAAPDNARVVLAQQPLQPLGVHDEGAGEIGK